MLFLRQFHSMQIDMVHTALINEEPSWWFGGMLAVFNISIHLSVFALTLFRRWLNPSGESFNFLSDVIGLECFDHAEICPTPVMAILWWFQADLLCTSKAWKDHSTTHSFGSTFWSLLNTHEPYCYKKWASITHLKKNMWLVLSSLYLLFLKSKGFYVAIPQSLYYCVQINSYLRKVKDDFLVMLQD